MDQAETEAEANGCQHYERQCDVLAECCQQWFGCRLCHKEQVEGHEIDRHAIRKMRCRACHTEQPCARECVNCKLVMADYFCRVCNLFDNLGQQKQIFHCDGCGICRVGGRENFFHCDTCCGCYPLSLNNKHKCLQGSMHRECAICMEVTFASVESVNVLPCGHVLHGSCRKTYIEFGHRVCPWCRGTLFWPVDENDAGDGNDSDVEIIEFEDVDDEDMDEDEEEQSDGEDDSADEDEEDGGFDSEQDDLSGSEQEYEDDATSTGTGVATEHASDLEQVSPPSSVATAATGHTSGAESASDAASSNTIFTFSHENDDSDNDQDSLPSSSSASAAASDH